MLVMRNGSTGSTWPITNCPEARYNKRSPDACATNLGLPLWKLIRASAAAPVYFPTEMVKVSTQTGQEKLFEFLDGSISRYDNPILAMFLAATLPP